MFFFKNQSRLNISMILLGCLVSVSSIGGTPAKEVIETFYKGYLSFDFDAKARARHSNLRFSKLFNDLVEINDKICREKAGSDICGWWANGDIYLDAQEYKPENYKKAGLKLKEMGGGKIVASFNVYPSLKDSKKHYDRQITFLMIAEGGEWVVNDIVYQHGSARKQIQKEIEFYQGAKK